MTESPPAFEHGLNTVEQGGCMDIDLAEAAMRCVMRGQVPDHELARWLGAMALRVPDVPELLGFVKAFLADMVRVPCATPPERRSEEHTSEL